jgi:hypothetical protein
MSPAADDAHLGPQPNSQQVPGRKKKEFLSANRSAVVDDLPGYASELNPDELVWCWIKCPTVAMRDSAVVLSRNLHFLVPRSW